MRPPRDTIDEKAIMKFAIPLVVVAAILAVGTYVEGKLSDRWFGASSAKLERFTELVPQVPMEVGDWKATNDTELSKEEFAKTNCTAYISRTYRNPEGQSVNVYLVSGTGRHTTIHTPDWCYVGAGYDKIDDPQQYRIRTGEVVQDSDPEFLTTRFRKEDTRGVDEIRIFWTFSDNGQWAGPRDPKNEFGGRPAMYKIYFITNVAEVGMDIESNPTTSFVKEFIPAINDILFQEPEAPAETPTEETAG